MISFNYESMFHKCPKPWNHFLRLSNLYVVKLITIKLWLKTKLEHNNLLDLAYVETTRSAKYPRISLDAICEKSKICLSLLQG